MPTLYLGNNLVTVPGPPGQGVPVGSVIIWTSTTIPVGWLLCDGSAVSRTTYADLFSIVGTTYGTGDGITTFNLPDLRGRIPVGRDTLQTEFDTMGEAGGEKTHLLTIAESGVPPHTHLRPDLNVFATSAGGGTTYATTGAINSQTPNITGLDAAQAHNNLQPYRVLNYIINYRIEGSFPGGDGSQIWIGTQAEYDVITPTTDTIYIITDSSSATVGTMPTGGTTGSILQKTSGTDYDAQWVQPTDVFRPAPNYLINGGFEIWQRGTTFSGAVSPYCADRWHVYGNYSSGAITRETLNDNEGMYGLKLLITTKGGSFTEASICQPLETIDCLKFRNKTLTFSIKLQRNSTFNAGSANIVIRTGTGTDERWASTGASNTTLTIPYSSIPTSGYQTFSVTKTVPSNATQVCVYFQIANSSVPDGSYIISRSAQLTVSNGYVECEIRPYEEELRKCRRYCRAYYGANTFIAYGSSYSTTAAQMQISFVDCPMRTAPAVNFSNITDIRVTVSNVAALNVVSLISSSATPNTVVFNLSHSSNASFGSNKIVDCGILGTSGQLTLDAEL